MNISTKAGGYESNNLAFSIKTSSGDEIDFSAYKESSASISSEQKDGVSTQTAELSISQGYKFHYEGNGLDENDMKEINKAMKDLKPSIDSFMKESGNKDVVGRELEGIASQVKASLPEPKTNDAKSFLKESIANVFDDAFKAFDNSKKVFDNAKRLLDKIFGKIDGSEKGFYA
jgi:hypothetical protein